jgi:hypothetical protein
MIEEGAPEIAQKDHPRAFDHAIAFDLIHDIVSMLAGISGALFYESPDNSACGQ